MILLLLACTAPLGERDGPSMADAVAPLLTTLDRDHDGRVGEAEYAAVAPAGPAFAAVDTDKDGALGVAELVALVNQPPAVEAPSPPTPDGRAAPGRQKAPDGSRAIGDALHFLAAEAAAKDPSLPLPSEDEIARAARTGTLDSDASQQVLRSLAAAWAQVGLTFPTISSADPPATGINNSP